jgi:hypothetical protein
MPSVAVISPSVNSKPKHVSHSRGRKLMREMVRFLEAKYGNPPRVKIYGGIK